MDARSFRPTLFLFLCGAILAPRLALGTDADYFEPANYYKVGQTAGGTPVEQLPIANIKAALNTIVKTGVQSRSYEAAKSALPITDADPTNLSMMYTVYDRTTIVGNWSTGLWNREHTWPHSRGVDDGPADSDLFLLRPALVASNGDRADLNFGGAFGTSLTGKKINDPTNGNALMWYPGDKEAGTVARQQFFLDVRYEANEGLTRDLDLGVGNIANPAGASDAPPQLGDLNRLIEYNYAVAPDTFERRRNQAIYSSTMNPSYYQGNRNPFTDHPEWVWAVFKGDNNNSQITISGGTADANGGSTKTVDLGRIFVGGSVPAAQSVTLNKSGVNGTYYQVTAADAATSTLSGRFNAFKSSQTDSKSFDVGLSTTTSAAGIKSGTVTIDNLDITTGGGAGKGGNDGNDLITVSLNVLDHATPSFAGIGPAVTSKTIDFGSVTQGSALSPFSYDIFDLAGGAGAGSTAKLDFDSFNLTTSTGDLGLLTTGLSTFSNLLAGTSQTFMAAMSTAAIGSFSATYSLSLSDENLTEAQNGKLLSLTFVGSVTSSLLAGDYNGDHVVDAADYTVWQDSFGASVTAFEGADGNGDMVVNDDDYTVWLNAFNSGQPGAGGGGSAFSAAVPEPASMTLVLVSAIFIISIKRIRLAAC